MPSLSERRIDAWTALAAEPAVGAAERAIATESSTVLGETLAIAASAEARKRLTHVLDLKERAEREAGSREAYQRAADDLRSWAAAVYLATLREAPARPARPMRQPSVRHANPHTEESISVRRLVPRPPFPGQQRRHPYHREAPSGEVGAVRAVAAASPTDSHMQRSAVECDEAARKDMGRASAAA